MSEKDQDVFIHGSVFPDTVTLRLFNDERNRFVRYHRSCVSRKLYEKLYETMCDVIEAWRKENAELLLENDELKSENAKLREELEQWHKLTAGIELPEYPITQFQPKDLERENVKLIEFASTMYRSILLVPDDHIPAETKTRYFETAVSLGLDVPDD